MKLINIVSEPKQRRFLHELKEKLERKEGGRPMPKSPPVCNNGLANCIAHYEQENLIISRVNA